MAHPFKLACIQNSAVAEVERNIAVAAALTRSAAALGAAFICLPEYFSGVTLKDGLLHPAAFEESRHPVLQAFAIYLAALTMSFNLLVDVLYKLVDPRVVLK